MLELPLFPPAASVQATEVDRLYFFLCAVSFLMTALIFLCIFVFAIKYRRRSPNEQPKQIQGSLLLELGWSIAPFIVMLVMFFWGTRIFYAGSVPPRNAMEVFVTGKQWMWKMQYPNGKHEIDELHVPVGQPVMLTMASEDVIHSFSIPAFRVKHDVVPGHYDRVWFTATKPGRYHLFCTEFCGNQHASMTGWVTVLDRREYQEWESGGDTGSSMADQGRQLFDQYGCSNCHFGNNHGRCPTLFGLYSSKVRLNDGRVITADEAYIRESILDPNAKIVDGYEPNVMPVFQGQVSEEAVTRLVTYLKSLMPNSVTPPSVSEPARAEGGATTRPVRKGGADGGNNVPSPGR